MLHLRYPMTYSVRCPSGFSTPLDGYPGFHTLQTSTQTPKAETGSSSWASALSSLKRNWWNNSSKAWSWHQRCHLPWCTFFFRSCMRVCLRNQGTPVMWHATWSGYWEELVVLDAGCERVTAAEESSFSRETRWEPGSGAAVGKSCSVRNNTGAFIVVFLVQFATMLCCSSWLPLYLARQTRNWCKLLFCRLHLCFPWKHRCFTSNILHLVNLKRLW